ncbi:hypothetical protein G7Y79_00054g089070 [Physcia stellaris]|nr:hypothetical protein G7Y79_00054g089070 [Physcia stellaris]
MRTSHQLSSSDLSLPADTYIYHVIRITGSNLFASISSNDALRVIDESLQLLPSSAFDRVHDGVTCLENFEASAGCLVTAGRDAVVKAWDPRTGAQSLQLPNRTNAPYLALASVENKLAVGSELSNSKASIALWSICLNELARRGADKCTDGLVNLFDTTITDEDEALLQITNHGSSIHHARFLSSTEFYALSHDETLSIYSLDTIKGGNNDVPPTKFGDLRARLDCDYVVNISNLGDGNAVLGAGSHSKQHLDLVPLRHTSEWSLDLQHGIRLPTAHGEEIVRSMCFGTTEQTLLTGGEDGQVKAWQLPSDDVVADVAMSEESKDSKKRKKQDDLGSEKRRFKPY